MLPAVGEEWEGFRRMALSGTANQTATRTCRQEIWRVPIHLPNPARHDVYFGIEADPELDLFARIAAIFNVADIARVGRSCVENRPRRPNPVAIERAGAGIAEMIHRKLEQFTSTRCVELVVGNG